MTPRYFIIAENQNLKGPKSRRDFIFVENQNLKGPKSRRDVIFSITDWEDKRQNLKIALNLHIQHLDLPGK